MAEIIIIRGMQNSGKTTTSGLIYQELFKKSKPNHTFNNKIVATESLLFNEKGETKDFIAVLEIEGIKIGIISEGDEADPLKTRLNDMLKIKMEIIICCARSKNMKGSSYRMIIDEFSKSNNITNIFITDYRNKSSENTSIKDLNTKKIKDCVFDKIAILKTK